MMNKLKDIDKKLKTVKIVFAMEMNYIDCLNVDE